MVDTPVSGTGGLCRVGSSPIPSTNSHLRGEPRFFLALKKTMSHHSLYRIIPKNPNARKIRMR